MLLVCYSCGFLLLTSVNAFAMPCSSYSRLLSVDQMKGLMKHIVEANLPQEYFDRLLPFKLASATLGYLSPSFAAQLQDYPHVFKLNDDRNSPTVELTESLVAQSVEKRSESVAAVTAELRDKGIITGWRNELLPAACSFSSPPEILVERAAYPFFGLKGYGVHVNGFISDPDTRAVTHLWVAKRSATKSTWPGMLDHIVAGGQPCGISIVDNVAKECQEEASIPSDLANTALPVGAVSYNSLDEGGNLKRDCLFCFDIELPRSFTPTPQDGEVESFQLQTVDWVLEKVIAGGPTGYKPNCNLVLIDFFVR